MAILLGKEFPDSVRVPGSIMFKRACNWTLVQTSPHLHATFSKICFNIIFEWISMKFESRISQSVQRLGYGLDDRGIGVGFPVGVRDFSLFHRVQTGSGAHPAFYTIRTGGCFLGGKTKRVWNNTSPPSSSEVNNGGAIPPLTHTSPRHGP
jgi:hypothetical protein